VATIHWKSAVPGPFSTASDWSSGTVPGSIDTALIDSAGSYTVTSATSNTVDALGVIGTVTLDITAGTFTVLDGTAGTGLAGTVKVEDAAALSLGGTVDNTGTIQVLGTSAAGAALSVNTTTVVLHGGGAIQFSNDTANTFGGPGLTYALDNVDNKISGAGSIGNNTMGLTNETAGVIDANQSSPLTINTGADEVINFGTMEATAGGDLVIDSNVNNQGGTIEAVGAGSTVTLQAQVFGGVIKALSGGVIVSNLTNLSLDGLGSHPVTNAANLSIADGHTISLAGSITNNGTIGLHSTGDNTDFRIVAGIVVLSGNGQVQLSNNGANRIYATAGQFIFDNVSNTIDGAGQLGTGNQSMTFINSGLVDANQATALSVNTQNEFLTNSGTMEATVAGGGLVISNTAVLNAGGTIAAVGSGVSVSLNGADIEGGTLTSSGGGVVNLAGAQLDGFSNDDGSLTNNGSLLVGNWNTAYVTGNIINNGVIALSQSSTSGNTALIFNGAMTTLQGGGQVILNDNGGNYINAQNTAELDNVNNTISGSGRLGTGYRSLVFVNGAKGVVDATGSANALVINTNGEVLTNQGTLEATGTSSLAPGLVISQTVVNNAGGLIQGVGLGGLVDLSGSSIQGGTLATVGAGLIQTTDNASLDGITNGVINNTGLFAIQNNATLTLYGTINNTGTIQDNATVNNSDLVIGSQITTLEGAGTVQLSDSNTNRVYGNTLDNVNNVIEGSGQFGTGYRSLAFINQAAGTLDATGVVNALVVNTQGIALVNAGLLEDTGTAGLSLYQTAVANTGGIVLASGSGSHVNLSGGAGIQGGTLKTSGGGVIETTGGSTGYLDGLASDNGPLTSTASVLVNDNTTLDLYGSIVNEGTIQLAAVANNTDLVVDSAAVTLSGGGKVLMSDVGTNRIYGGNNSLINVDNTISGAGQIGVGYLSVSVTNEAKGVIDANDAFSRSAPGSLTINTYGDLFHNAGLLESTGSGGLVITQTNIVNTGMVQAAGAGTNVDLTGGSNIEGGTLETSGGGVIAVTGVGGLDGYDAGTIANTGLVQVNDQETLYLDGTINNTGTIFLDEVSASGNTSLILGTQTVTLAGKGQVIMSDVSGNRIYGASPTDNLINVGNTISGVGQLGAGQMTFTNGGIVNANQASGQIVINLGGYILTNQAGGQLLGTGAAGLVMSNLVLFNSGLIEATDGSSVVMQSNVYNFNVEEGEISGGTWEAVATGHGATLDITGGPVTTDSATIILSGSGSSINWYNGNTGTYDAIETSLTSISAGASLEILGNRGYTTTNTISDQGLLVLNGGTFSSAGVLTVGPAGILRGYGVVTPAVVSSGLLDAQGGGTLALTGAVTSTGVLEADAGSVLQLNEAALTTVTTGVTLNGVGSEIQFGTAAPFTTLESSLTKIASGTFAVLGGRGYVTTKALTDDANIQVAGGTFTAASLGLGATGVFEGYGTVTTKLTGGGEVISNGGLLTLSGGATGTTEMIAHAGSTLELGASSSVGAVSDGGTLKLDGNTYTATSLTVVAGGRILGFGTLTNAVANGGSIESNGGLLKLAAGATGTGGLVVDAGSTLELAAATTAGAITDNGTLKLDGLSTTTTKLTVATTGTVTGLGTITGPVANAGEITATSGTLSVAGSLTDTGTLNAAASATLAASAGGTLSGSITGTGTLSLSGAAAFTTSGALNVDTAVINAANVTVGSGALSFLGAVTNNDIIATGAHTASFSDSVGGTGTITVGAGGTASLLDGSAAGEAVNFLATSGAIDLGTPLSFAGKIGGFAHGNTIDLLSTIATGETFAANVLTLTNGATTVAKLDMTGSYTSSSFILGTDGHGGTLITHT
jgi:hypothetical protein